MNITFTRSFERTLAPSPKNQKIKESAEKILTAFEEGQKPAGVGLKKLRDNIWEARVDIRVRVLFAIEPGELKFLLAGDHNEIKKYLKNS